MTRSFTALLTSLLASAAAVAVFLAVCPRSFADNVDLPNFHTVSPGIYRGAAPTEAGLARLRQMGVHTIIDLRYPTKPIRREKQEAESLGFEWINLPMGAEAPTQSEVDTLLAELKKAPQVPVYVHCQHGADRTGCMIGIYRVTQQGWAFPQAWTEMRRYGFNPRWTHLTDAVRSRAAH